MIHPQEITGIVLAGGKSSRFGSNKALCEYRNKSFIQGAIDLLRPYTKQVVISGYNREYTGLEVKMLEDLYTDTGPLGGIYTALAYAKTDWILVLTCDMPLMKSGIITSMLPAAREVNIVGWRDEASGISFPLLISKKMLPRIKEKIENKQYRVRGLFEKDDTLLLTIPAGLASCFSNINNLQEYEKII